MVRLVRIFNLTLDHLNTFSISFCLLTLFLLNFAHCEEDEKKERWQEWCHEAPRPTPTAEQDPRREEKAKKEGQKKQGKELVRGGKGPSNWGGRGVRSFYATDKKCI